MPVIIKDGLFTVGVFVRMHYFLIGRIYMLNLKRHYWFWSVNHNSIGGGGKYEKGDAKFS